MKTFLAVVLAILANMAAAAEMNSPAQDFTLKSTMGTNLRLSEYRGQVVMLNFWASWCGPCRQEMPLLDQIHNKYQKLGFSVFGVNVDKEPEKADKLLKDIPVSFPILFDTDSKVSEMYGVDAMPTTIMIDRSGKMRYLHRGYKPGYEMEYEKQVKALIRE